MLFLLACAEPAATDTGAKDTLHTWYADWDGDGFGDPWSDEDAATAPAGWVADATDCDDTRADVFPNAPEVCNERDDNCDGVIDPPDSTDAPIWWADADGDGWGDPGAVSAGCAMAAGSVAPGEADCDDDDAAIHPGGVDSCADGVDGDCDGADTVCGRERSLGLATWTLEGESIGGRLGGAVALARDGSGEAAVAQDPGHDDTPCIAVVVAAGTTGTLGPLAAAARVNDVCSVEAFTDLDGDGLADLLGVDAVDGLHAWNGPLRGDLALADAALSWGDTLYLAAPTPDVDGDTLVDLWAASSDATAGQLLLRSGAGGDAVLAALGDETVYGGTAYALIADQDLDGDGQSDVVVWDHRCVYYGNYWDYVTVYLGPGDGWRTSAEADARILVSQFGEYGGLGAGDLDGDGLADVAIGTVAWTEAGLVSLFRGAPTGDLELADAWATWTGASLADEAGAVLRADADADADGQDDLFASAPGGPGGWHYGGAHVVLGPVAAGAWSLADSNLLWVGDTWAEAGDTLDAADVDGDGAAELLLGAQEWDPLRVRGAAWLLPGGLR